MKTIGLLGGMSWESTVGYYSALNEGVQRALGGRHSARIVLVSVDFDPIEKLQHRGDWRGAAEVLSKAAREVQSAGADFLLLCTNTMHRVAPDIEHAVSIPLLHIADATAGRLLDDGIGRVGLLGTSFTMEQDFYKGRLKDKHGLEVVIPDAADGHLVHEVIYDELCLGRIRDESRTAYLRVIEKLAGEGAEAVILGCTEISMLVRQDDTPVRLYDTAAIHAEKAVAHALNTGP